MNTETTSLGNQFAGLNVTSIRMKYRNRNMAIFLKTTFPLHDFNSRQPKHKGKGSICIYIRVCMGTKKILLPEVGKNFTMFLIRGATKFIKLVKTSNKSHSVIMDNGHPCIFFVCV